jgi:hypothetical protein
MNAWNRYQSRTPQEAASLIAEDLASMTSKQYIHGSMCRAGWNEEEAALLIESVSNIVQKKLEQQHLNAVLRNGAFAILGFAISLGSYLATVNTGGGRFLIAWGAVIFGLYYCYKAFQDWNEYRSLSREELHPKRH